MTPQVLRDYQLRAVDDTLVALAHHPCLVMPTGAGKTTTGTEIIHRAGLPTLWLAHRRELIQQAAERLRAAGLRVGVIMAGVRPDPTCPVQVASVQTLRKRQAPPASLIVIDEAHHATASTYGEVLARYPNAARVGLTATPFRLDGAGLGDLFGVLIVAAHADELVAAGTLIEPRVYAPSSVNLSGVRVRMGDYEQGKLAKAVDTPKLVGDVVKTWLKLSPGRRTVLFAVNVAHSKHLIDAFVAAGVPAEHIDGKTEKADRAAALARLAAGKTLVMSNCQVLTEGWDLPALETAIVARPTASLGLHLQMIGRVMRACPGKSGAVVLDHAGNFLRHGRVTQRLEYSLAGPVRRAGGAKSTGLRTCMVCYRMVLSSRKTCPDCGADLTREAEIPEAAEGELTEYSGDAVTVSIDWAERAQAWWELEQRTRERGYKPGFALVRYKERFGAWPVVIGDVGERVLVTPEADDDIKTAVYRKFAAEAEVKGWKPLYAGVRFKELFGEWPRREHRGEGVSEGLFAGAKV